MQSLRIITVGLLGLWGGTLQAQDSAPDKAPKRWEQLVQISNTPYVWPSTSSIKFIEPTTVESYAWLHDEGATSPTALYPGKTRFRIDPWWSLWMVHVLRSDKSRAP